VRGANLRTVLFQIDWYTASGILEILKHDNVHPRSDTLEGRDQYMQIIYKLILHTK